MSNAMMNSRSPRNPIVYRRPLEIEKEEYPPPAPEAFQTSGGPPSGHCFRRPVSFEMPSRFAPRHCGHSPLVWANAVKANERKKSNALAINVTREFLIRNGPPRSWLHWLSSCSEFTGVVRQFKPYDWSASVLACRTLASLQAIMTAA